MLKSIPERAALAAGLIARLAQGGTHDHPKSKRQVGPIALLALGINGIVGVGIFFAPADVARGAPGWQSIVIFAVTGLALIPVAVTFSSIGKRFDEDGGPVVFARAAFGDLPSFLVGWIAYVSAIASTTAVVSGMTAAVAPLFHLETQLAKSLAADGAGHGAGPRLRRRHPSVGLGLDRAHGLQARPARGPRRRLRSRGVPRTRVAGNRGAGIVAAASGAPRHLYVPRVRGRPGHRRPGPVFGAGDPLGDRRRPRVVDPALCGASGRLRRRAAGPRLLDLPSGRRRRGPWQRHPRRNHRRGDQHLRARDRLRHDGHFAPLPVGPRRRREIAPFRLRASRAQRRAPSGALRDLGCWSSRCCRREA